MRALRSVLGLDGEQLATLMTSGWKVDPAQRTPLAWMDVSFRLEGPPSTVIGSGVGLPHLKALGLAAPPRGRAFTPPGELRWLFDSPLLERVETLTLSGVGPLGDVIATLGTRQRRVVALHQRWEPHFGRLPSGRCERLSLGDGRCDLVIAPPALQPHAATSFADEVVQALATVGAATLTSLRVRLPAGQDVAVVKQAARRFSRLEVCEVDLEGETR